MPPIRKSIREFAQKYFRIPKTWGIALGMLALFALISIAVRAHATVQPAREFFSQNPFRTERDISAFRPASVQGTLPPVSEEQKGHESSYPFENYVTSVMPEEVMLTRKAQELLDDVLGEDNTKVVIHILVENKRKYFWNESLDPDSVIASESISSGQSAVTWNNGKSIREESEAPGGIKRLYLTILVRGKDDHASGLSDLELAQDLVKNAVGFDETRGDVIFARQVSGPLSPMQSYWREGASRSLAAGIFLGLLIFALIWAVRKKDQREGKECIGQSGEGEGHPRERMLKDLRTMAQHRPDWIVRAVEDYLFETNLSKG